MTIGLYKIPDEYFFDLHHVRPRFKNNVEEVLLYVANSISELNISAASDFNTELNNVLTSFSKNRFSTKKTIDNWRTEISALFAFIQEENGQLRPSLTATRLAKDQYLDEFFNYFLYSFQYPGGHVKPRTIINQIKAGIKFKPCQFILQILLEGELLTGKAFKITAEELTQCAYYDLRVTRDGRTPKEVAELIEHNRTHKVEYDFKYEQLKSSSGQYRSKGDTMRYAGDILDYMVLANILDDRGTGFYYYLNSENITAINFHTKNESWFYGYDEFYDQSNIPIGKIASIEEDWFAYVNYFDNISEFLPHLNKDQSENISALIQEYYVQLTGDRKVPTKLIGDYGETLIIAHEYLRTRPLSNRQHLINKIPTPLGVGYDIQSIEIEKMKRYIEVKTTKSLKALNNNRFRLTPNEWDTAETLGDSYFIYYLVVTRLKKSVFVIQNPVKHCLEGRIKIDKTLLVEFKNDSGTWMDLLEI